MPSSISHVQANTKDIAKGPLPKGGAGLVREIVEHGRIRGASRMKEENAKVGFGLVLVG